MLSHYTAYQHAAPFKCQLTKNVTKDSALLESQMVPLTKLKPKFIGPYAIIAINPSHSTVTLNIPGPTNKCQVFYTSLIKPFRHQEVINNDL